jgi:hypothetical protein
LWKKIYIKTYCFLLISSGCKTRSSLIQNLSRFWRWKSFHRQFCLMTRIFIVKIFETVVRLSEVLAHTKKLLVCNVTNVSIQAFVEGLLRLANELEATHWTLQTVNNMCTLAINSTKYVVLFSGDLTGIRWQVLHMSTTFAVFVSTWVNIDIVVLGLRYMCNIIKITALLMICLSVFIHYHDEWFVKSRNVTCLERRNFCNRTMIKIIQMVQ